MNESSASSHQLADPLIEIEVVVKALDQLTQPITAKQLRERLTGPFKLSEDRLAQLLEEQVTAGRVHRFLPLGRSKQPRYWSRNMDEFAREQMLNLLSRHTRTQTELLRKLKTRLSGYSDEKQKALLSRLVREKVVQNIPPLIGSRTARYCTKPPDPRDYLEDVVAKLSKKLGLSREEILNAARLLSSAPVNNTQNDLSEKLLARMVQVKLAAAQGGLVPLNELWQSLQNEGWDRASFDRTVLSLAEHYRVSLQRHNFPASLTEKERAELVTDGLGNYYVGIALR